MIYNKLDEIDEEFIETEEEPVKIKPVKAIIYYSENPEVFNLEDSYILSRDILFDINKNEVINEFKEDTLYDILEKIYNEVYVNELYKYIPYIKISLQIDDTLTKPIFQLKFNIKDDILRFKQKYDEDSIENYGHDSMFYILQILNKIYIDQHNLNIDELEFILNNNCKVKFLNLHNYININVLQQFLINNQSLEYLHICVNDPNDITRLCEGLSENKFLSNLDLRYSHDLTFDDLTQIINSSNSIINYNFSYICLKNDLNLDLLLNTLMYNTIINSFNMRCTDNDVSNFHKLYYPLDEKIISLLKNNTTLNTLNMFESNFKKCFKSFEESILIGLKSNTTLISLGKYN